MCVAIVRAGLQFNGRSNYHSDTNCHHPPHPFFYLVLLTHPSPLSLSIPSHTPLTPFFIYPFSRTPHPFLYLSLLTHLSPLSLSIPSHTPLTPFFIYPFSHTPQPVSIFHLLPPHLFIYHPLIPFCTFPFPPTRFPPPTSSLSLFPPSHTVLTLLLVSPFSPPSPLYLSPPSHTVPTPFFYSPFSPPPPSFLYLPPTPPSPLSDCTCTL